MAGSTATTHAYHWWILWRSSDKYCVYVYLSIKTFFQFNTIQFLNVFRHGKRTIYMIIFGLNKSAYHWKSPFSMSGTTPTTHAYHWWILWRSSDKYCVYVYLSIKTFFQFNTNQLLNVFRHGKRTIYIWLFGLNKSVYHWKSSFSTYVWNNANDARVSLTNLVTQLWYKYCVYVYLSIKTFFFQFNTIQFLNVFRHGKRTIYMISGSHSLALLYNIQFVTN
jgi:hypothetical protein